MRTSSSTGVLLSAGPGALPGPPPPGAGRPRQPTTGRPNLATSRSVNAPRRPSHGPRPPLAAPGAPAVLPRRASTRAPGGRSTLRRPSHHRTASDVSSWPPASMRNLLPDSPSTSTASTDHGETTIGPANSACALIGTSSSASTSGQTIGPPAENAYAVEPVGVAQMTPSHAHRDSGRPSISVTTSIMRARAIFSTLASLSAQVVAVTAPSCRTDTSIVIRSSTVYPCSTTWSTAPARSSGSVSARKPTWPRLTPSRGARRAGPSPRPAAACRRRRERSPSRRPARHPGWPGPRQRRRSADRPLPARGSARLSRRRRAGPPPGARCARAAGAADMAGHHGTVRLVSLRSLHDACRRSRGPSAGAPRRSQRKYSTLPDGPAAGSRSRRARRAPDPRPRRPPTRPLPRAEPGHAPRHPHRPGPCPPRTAA